MSLSVLGLAFVIPFVPAAEVATGTMTTARAQHTATLLNDGRVLLAGGDCPRFAQAKCETAEIYDPATKRFTKTGSLRQERKGHAATLMPDGRVLITGGHSFGIGVPLVEIYDPRTGQFSEVGSLQVARESGTAALLDDGRVILGGLNPAEIYDLRSKTSVLLDAGVLVGATPIVLSNQRILFAGGAYGYLSQYDLQAKTYQQFYMTRQSRLRLNSFESVTMQLDGRVLVAGGSEFCSAFLYDAGGVEPVMVPNFQNDVACRYAHTSTALPDGSLLLYGGNGDGDMTPVNEILDPVTLRFRADLAASYRASHTATLLLDGTVLIAGGSVQTDHIVEHRRFLDTAVVYTPERPAPAAQIHVAPGTIETQGAILHAGSSRVATGEDPAVAGEILEMFVAGLAEKGKRSPSVAIGGLAAEVLYFGAAPGYSNLFQVNVRVPLDVAPGPAIPVRMNYLDRPSNEVTIGVR